MSVMYSLLVSGMLLVYFGALLFRAKWLGVWLAGLGVVAIFTAVWLGVISR